MFSPSYLREPSRRLTRELRHRSSKKKKNKDVAKGSSNSSSTAATKRLLRRLGPVAKNLAWAIETCDAHLEIDGWDVADSDISAARVVAKHWYTLVSLSASGTKITHGGDAFGRRSLRLVSINVNRTACISDIFLLKVSSSCPMLQKLRVAGCRRLTDKGLSKLNALQHLMLFDCARCPHITSGSLGLRFAIQNCTSLRMSGNENLVDAVVEATLLKVPYGYAQRAHIKLVHVDFSGLNCSDKMIEHLVLAHIWNLQFISLAGSVNLTDRGISSLKNALRNVKHVNVDGCSRLTNLFLFETLCSCSESLRVLNISNMSLLTSRGICKLLGRLQKLGTLSCGGSTGVNFSVEEAQKLALAVSKMLYLHRLNITASSILARKTGFMTILMKNLIAQRRNNVDNIAMFDGVEASQISTPISFRGAALALKGDISGIFGQAADDKKATTTITLLESEAWLDIDLKKVYNVESWEVFFPGNETNGRQWVYPVWLMAREEPFESTGLSLRQALNQSTHKQRFDTGRRAIRSKVFARVRYFRIQQEKVDESDVRLLPVACVRIFLQRLSHIDVSFNDLDSEQIQNIIQLAPRLDVLNVTGCVIPETLFKQIRGSLGTRSKILCAEQQDIEADWPQLLE